MGLEKSSPIILSRRSYTWRCRDLLLMALVAAAEALLTDVRGLCPRDLIA